MGKLDSYPKHSLLLLGQLFAQLSDRMMSIGLVWVISKNFGDQWVTWYLVIGGLPHLLFFAWSAKLIQARGALKVVMCADGLRSLIYLFAGIFISALESQSQLFNVMILIFATNLMAAFFNPAIFSLPVEIESGQGIQKLTARLSALMSLSSVLGPVLGIFCFQWLGLHGLFFMTSAFYLLSGLCAWTLLPKQQATQQSTQEILPLLKTPTPEFAPEFVTGRFAAFQIHPMLASMLLVFLMMNLLTTPIQILLPSLAKNVFAGSFNALAAMEVGLGSGLSFGGLILSIFSIQNKTLFYLWIFLVGCGVSFLAIHYAANLPMTVLMLAALGLFVGLSNILTLNIFQSFAPPDQVPKIMSLVNLISSAALPFSLLGAGLLQTYYSIHLIVEVCGFILVGVCFASWLPFRHWGKALFQ